MCDKTLRKGGFCGEGLLGTSVVAVKSHSQSMQWDRRRNSERDFDKAIFLIRNPFDASIAEWHRLRTSYVATGRAGSSHVWYVSSQSYFGKEFMCTCNGLHVDNVIHSTKNSPNPAWHNNNIVHV